MDNTYSITVDTPIGGLNIVANDVAVVQVRLPGPGPEGAVSRIASPGRHPVLDLAVDELSRYFRGRLKAFTVPVSFGQGTEFQRNVWTALASIPYGETRTYSWVAREVGRPTAVRAVGHACGQNPVAIIVPCHRVVGVDGSLTGYAGGIECKQALLALEHRFRTSRR